MGATTYSDIGPVEIERLTPKAVKIKRGTEEHWMPLSVLDADTRSQIEPTTKKLSVFEVADWFIEKERIEV